MKQETSALDIKESLEKRGALATLAAYAQTEPRGRRPATIPFDGPTRGVYVLAMCRGLTTFMDWYYSVHKGKTGCRDLLIAIADENRWFEETFRPQLIFLLHHTLEQSRGEWGVLEELTEHPRKVELLITLSRQAAQALLPMIANAEKPL